MARTLATQLLEEATRAAVLAGHSKYAAIEDKVDYTEHNALGAGNDLTSGNSNNPAGNEQNMGGPEVVQHPELMDMGGLPSPFNPDPDQLEDPQSSHDLLLSADAQRSKNENKLKNKQKLEEKPKQKLQNRQRYTNTPRPTPG